jgi:SAM-dependent methyltransferase
MRPAPRLQRPELLREGPQEWFAVPAFVPPRGWKGAFLVRLRHLLDPAAASIWRDLSQLLASVEGDFLDVGCGSQPYRPLLPPGVRYQGVDRLETRVAFGYEVPDTLYYEGERWPVADASQDCVLCTEVLEHVPDPRAFLQEARRCLRPGGLLILTVPFSARVHYMPHDYYRYTPFGLKVLAEQAGLSDVQVWGRGNPLTVACSKVLGLVLPTVLRGGARWHPKHLLLVLILGPIGLLAGLVARASMSLNFGDDVIGFTALARKPDAP